MKTYKFTESGILVDGQPLKFKKLSNEPADYTNPDRVALSILADCVGDSVAMLHAHELQREIVNNCKVGQEISSDEIQEWNDFKCQIGASVQSAVWSRQGTEPQPVSSTPWRLPRLLRVQRQWDGKSSNPEPQQRAS